MRVVCIASIIDDDDVGRRGVLGEHCLETTVQFVRPIKRGDDHINSWGADRLT